MTDPVINRKRGRPAKPRSKDSNFSGMKESEILWMIDGTNHSEQLQQKLKAQTRQVELFNELKAEYLDHGVSQQSQLLLRKIAFSPDVPKS